MSCSCHSDRQPNAIAPNRTLFQTFVLHILSRCSHNWSTHSSEPFCFSLIHLHTPFHSFIHSFYSHSRPPSTKRISFAQRRHPHAIYIHSVHWWTRWIAWVLVLFVVAAFFSFPIFVLSTLFPIQWKNVSMPCALRESEKKVERFLSIRFKIDVSLPTLKLSYF